MPVMWTQAMAEQPEDNEASLIALGLARRHLEEVLLDGRVLPLGAFRPLPGCQHVAGTDSHPDLPKHMALDGSAFDNLEVSTRPPLLQRMTVGATHWHQERTTRTTWFYLPRDADLQISHSSQIVTEC